MVCIQETTSTHSAKVCNTTLEFQQQSSSAGDLFPTFSIAEMTGYIGIFILLWCIIRSSSSKKCEIKCAGRVSKSTNLVTRARGSSTISATSGYVLVRELQKHISPRSPISQRQSTPPVSITSEKFWKPYTPVDKQVSAADESNTEENAYCDKLVNKFQRKNGSLPFEHAQSLCGSLHTLSGATGVHLLAEFQARLKKKKQNTQC